MRDYKFVSDHVTDITLADVEPIDMIQTVL